MSINALDWGQIIAYTGQSWLDNRLNKPIKTRTMITKETEIANYSKLIEDLKALIVDTEIKRHYTYLKVRDMGKVAGNPENRELYRLNHTLDRLREAMSVLVAE